MKKIWCFCCFKSPVPTLENADNVDGCIGVTILGQGDINAKLLDKWYDLGIRYVSSRTIGLNHIDLEHAKENWNSSM